ncbi:large subunit ribosomal protein L7A [Hydrogenispora ethanolica]|uniref:Large subunit ribosomal protein L7A n=1 Tax=Hydrogenispora ethanolica TaxID=1082276 RepID=A0A4R1QL16_HYDET|nr:ribosomal L7Ae/L30e/S12e/Gadd45 family protein [Hydrogenispora ethanolica]TCL54306.1 large subunit ribosomal protein L7A [Hydrogenispora ethanolica]
MAHSVQAIREAKEKVIGLKQTLRAIQQNKVSAVYIANDIEDFLVKRITDCCQENKIPLTAVDFGQKELGHLCQIEVGASVVALIK